MAAITTARDTSGVPPAMDFELEGGSRPDGTPSAIDFSTQGRAAR